RSFTFLRLVARHENYLYKRKALADRGIDVRNWMFLGADGLRYRLLPFGSNVAFAALDRLRRFPDRLGAVLIIQFVPFCGPAKAPAFGAQGLCARAPREISGSMI